MPGGELDAATVLDSLGLAAGEARNGLGVTVLEQAIVAEIANGTVEIPPFPSALAKLAG